MLFRPYAIDLLQNITGTAETSEAKEKPKTVMYRTSAISLKDFQRTYNRSVPSC